MPTRTTHGVDVESIERLAEKVRDLVGVLERTRAELSQAIEDNASLSREAEQLRSALSNAESANAEVSNLLAEREQIRTRVGEMLEQLDEISV
jgi:regulator of replication initiation timing